MDADLTRTAAAVSGDSTRASLPLSMERNDTRAGPPIERMAVPCELHALGEDDQGRLRVRGVMHSFGRTFSRRLLHPQGFANWLKRNPGAKLPMLAQHGFVQSNFSTVGQWDKISFAGGRAVWEGWIGQGTELQTETRSLVKQGLAGGSRHTSSCKLHSKNCW